LTRESDLICVWSHRLTPRSLLARRAKRVQVGGVWDDRLVAMTSVVTSFPTPHAG
jgi:hypothetical protein